MSMCMASRKSYTQICIGSIAEHEIFHIHAIADTDYGHHVVCRPNCIRLCMTMYSMHILVSCDLKLLIAHINILSHIFQPV